MEKYRSDIDGLRAVAVISVVLFHAGVKWFGGGYVGVDVFFVISGYLITKYIDHKIQSRRFSIVEFYERRVRRIMPALFFLLLACSALAYYSLLPGAFLNFAKSLIATTVFSPNILLYKETSYFDTSAKLKPLLHMWSLGVEEQFYIFLPITLVLAAFGGRKSTLITLYTSFIASLAFSIWAVKSSPTAAFYLLPFRAWELLLGSIIAVGAFPRISNSLVRNILTALGVLAVVVSVFLYTSDTPFPGMAALLPCFGAAFVIYGNEGGLTLAGRALSWRPIVFVGLISYSLYLWHWPLLVFFEQFLARPLGKTEIAIAVLASFVAAIASWKYVEQPFRTRALGATRPVLFSIVGATAVAVLVLASVIIASHGFARRLSPQARIYAAGTLERDKELATCERTSNSIEHGELCRLGPNKATPVDFVVWGDSHAEALAPAFRAVAYQIGVMGWLATEHACGPLLGVTRISRDAPDCYKFNDSVVSAIERYHVHTVFLVARWDIVLGRTRFETAEGRGKVFLTDANTQEKSPAENERVFERGLTRTLSRLNNDGLNVVLVLDVPNTALDTSEFLAKSAARGVNLGPEVRIDIASEGGRLDSADTMLKRISGEWHAVVIDPKVYLCSTAGCLVAKDGRSLYRDDHHLTTFGALQLVDLIRPRIKEASSVAQFPRGAADLQDSQTSISAPIPQQN